MMRPHQRGGRQRWAIAIATLLALACGGTDQWLELNPEPSVQAQTFHLTGTVEYLNVEGGLFAIHASDGTTYNPVNLPDSFKIDKMAIEADARRREDLVSPAMIGPLVELLRIRPLHE